MPQTGFAQILRPLAGEEITGYLRTSASRPHADLVRMANARSRDRQFVAIGRKLFTNRCHDRSVLLLLHLGMLLVDPVQFDLIECRVAWNGRFVSVPARREIHSFIARHDDPQSVTKNGDGEFVGRIEGTLRRDERPGANARVSGPNLNGEKQLGALRICE